MLNYCHNCLKTFGAKLRTILNFDISEKSSIFFSDGIFFRPMRSRQTNTLREHLVTAVIFALGFDNRHIGTFLSNWTTGSIYKEECLYIFFYTLYKYVCLSFIQIDMLCPNLIKFCTRNHPNKQKYLKFRKNSFCFFFPPL